jgi:ribosomal protein S18 acetylase RimI-like enzyme
MPTLLRSSYAAALFAERDVFATNDGAIRLYERLGFEREGRRRGAIRIGDGFIDMLEMVKRV